MAYLIPDHSVDHDEKVTMMHDDARFDIADPDSEMSGSSPISKARVTNKQLPKVPKVFLSNQCQFNCAYCQCRQGNERKKPYNCTPRELAELSVRQANQAGSGIFLSSAIWRSADYTQELLIETLKIIRGDLGFGGFVHAKVMPGASPELIRRTGWYADRLSVNIEVAKSEGYEKVAKNKNKRNILSPMASISQLILEAKERQNRSAQSFATSQTTQLMAGSIGEDDRTILDLSGALYRKYALKRVYYTPFHYQDQASDYDELEPTVTPAWRVNRLYQADRLMQLYGFDAEEIAPQANVYLTRELDPKAAWALRNLHRFPVEVNKADYEELIRIPGIGITYARRILEARRYCIITHDTLRLLGIPQSRSRHFLTCNGKYQGETCERPERLYQLLADRDTGQQTLTGYSAG